MAGASMADYSFADRYAEAGLAPTAQVIADRQAPADRIVGAITKAQMLDLAGAYFGNPGPDLTWMRNEFAKEDASFSLVNNERETRVLAAAMLGSLVASGAAVAILAVTVGGLAGHRKPAEAAWLLRDAGAALVARSVSARQPAAVETKVVQTAAPKLGEEIAAVPVNDWAALLAVLGKMRAESSGSARTTSGQATAALTALGLQVRYLREESQMMWWLFGGHSRSLQRRFGDLGPQQAAVAGAVDLAALTTVSLLGPAAAPAMLERVILMSRRPKGAPARDLASAVDGLAAGDLERLGPLSRTLPSRLAPVTSAIELARTMGAGSWHARFRERTGFDAAVAMDPVVLAGQLYYECLLGQLL